VKTAYIILLTACTLVWADVPSISADDPIEFDEATQSMKAKGRARLMHEAFQLLSETIQFYKEQNRIEAKGDVAIAAKEIRLITPAVSCDMKKGTIDSDTFRLGKFPFFVEGNNIDGAVKDLHADHATLYYGEPDPFALNIRSRTMELEDLKILKLRHSVLRIGKVPFFYLPYYQKDITDESTVRWNGSYGFDKELGKYVRNEVLFSLGHPIKPGFLLDYYSKHGFMYGPAAEYKGKDFDGSLLTGYMRDTGNRGSDRFARPISESRGFARWYHVQGFGESIDATVKVDWSKDQEILRDFRPNEFDKNQYPDNFAEVAYRGEQTIVSAFTRFAPNNFQLIEQRLPEVRVDFMPYKVGESSLYLDGFLSYAHLRERRLPFAATEKRHSDRVDSYIGARYPLAHGDWVTFTPVVGARVTHYANTSTEKSSYTRGLGQVGFDLNCKGYRYWDFSNKTWNIDGLKHRIQPFLSYRYIPKASQGSADIPQIDRENDNANRINYPIIDLEHLRNTDELYEMNILRFGATNFLQTRSGIFSRDLVKLDLFQDFRFARHNTQKTLSDFYSIFNLTPAPWVSFDWKNRYNWESHSLAETRTTTTFTDSDVWKLSLSSSFLKDKTHEYSIDGKIRLSLRYAIKAKLTYNELARRVTDQRYIFEGHLGRNWRYEIYALIRHNDSRKTSEYGIAFELLDLLSSRQLALYSEDSSRKGK